MGFNPPVPQQDSNWEIRVAVLLSLLLQVLLIFLGPTRKRSSAPLASFAVLSCYLLADWVADLALGLLLNSMGNIGGSSSSSFGNDDSGSSSSPIIFAFWTPFLLLHLGGPDTITADSDNELWNHHLVGLLFELFSAAVIILCSMHGNPLIPATFLILLAGVVKYGERTYSLYSSSVESLRGSMLGPPDAGPNYAKFMTEVDSKRKAGLVVGVAIASSEKEADRLAMTLEWHAGILAMKSVEARAYDFFLNFRPLFIDIILSSGQRRLSQAFFVGRPDITPGEAFEVIEVELNFIYDMLYTKAPVVHTGAGWVLRCICSGCLAAALAIFVLLDKRRHNISRVDTGITYALLLGGLALDAVALLMLLLSNRVTVFLEQSEQLGWLVGLTRAAKKSRRTRCLSGKTSQLNLIGYCLQSKPEHNGRRGRSRWWLKVADKVGLEEIVDDYVFIKRVPLMKKGSSNSSLLDCIFDGLKGAAENLQEEEDIMEFCNRMGVLGRLGKDIKEALENDDEKLNLFRESVLKKDFDESLLLWHIATDLCLFKGIQKATMQGEERWHLKEEQRVPTQAEAQWQPIGETLSEYMLYLLIKQPDMLSATASIGLRAYRDTCAEVQRFVGSMDAWIENHHNAREMLLQVNTSEKPSTVKGYRSKSVLFDAVILAQTLMALNNDGLMWEVVSGVWLEMLTFAAGKCRGSTHVRKLNHGGELITLVWLLMQHMGLSDMYEIQEGDPSVKLNVRY
uniref:DUF4220 domain-containing protein n=1 Tax=Setaria viridis TaxID=4556 RepID=A0A4U6VM96_SETVI|nr:LOW QUALITY PROTEIN: hypothetical protein SEVIR_2G000400v2 [Setaria viridis]